MIWLDRNCMHSSIKCAISPIEKVTLSARHKISVYESEIRSLTVDVKCHGKSECKIASVALYSAMCLICYGKIFFNAIKQKSRWNFISLMFRM